MSKKKKVAVKKQRDEDGRFAEGNDVASENNQYKEKYCDKADEYLEDRVDKEVEFVKQKNEEKGYEMYGNKLKVQLPTIEGFARFLDFHIDTLYKWAEENPRFSEALRKIKTEQHDRLVNMGLSGDYNSTIAKLMLSSNHGYKERQENENPALNKELSETREALKEIFK